MPRSQGRHRRPVEAAAVAPPPPPRRPGRLAVGTAGATGAVALAIALVTVAAGPARNGDPTHHGNALGPSTSTPPGVPSGLGSATAGVVVTQAPGAAAPVPSFVGAQQRTALPLAPSTAPPRATPTASASPSPTQPGQRRGQGHHPSPTPTATSSGGSTTGILDQTLSTLP